MVLRSLWFGVIWWTLAGNDAESLVVGVPTVAAAVAASLRLRGTVQGVRIRGAVALARFFVMETIRSGVAVARLAFSRLNRLDPAIFEVRTILPPGAPRLLLANLTSALPGSVSVELAGDRLLVHAIAGEAAARQGVLALETRVAATFAPARAAAQPT